MFWVGVALAALALAQKGSIEDVPGYWETCANIYSQSGWRGSSSPGIDVDSAPINLNHVNIYRDPFTGIERDKGDAVLWQFAVVLYAHEDKDILGVPASDGHVEYVCSDSAIAAGLCTEDEYGTILLDTGRHSKLPVLTGLIDVDTSSGHHNQGRIHHRITYDVSNTSVYCAGIFPVQYSIDWTPNNDCIKVEHRKFGNNVPAQARFRSSYGYLAAPEGPLLILHFVITGICSVFVALWSWKWFQNRHNLVSIQRQIPIIGSLMAFEQLLSGSYYMSISKGKQYLGFLWFSAVFRAIRFVYMPFFCFCSAWATLSCGRH